MKRMIDPYILELPSLRRGRLSKDNRAAGVYPTLTTRSANGSTHESKQAPVRVHARHSVTR